MTKMHKTQQLALHWCPLIFQWSLDINLKPLAAPLRPISQTWPNKPPLAFTTCSLFLPSLLPAFPFSLSLFVADGDTVLSVFSPFWAADKWFIYYERSWFFATVGMLSYGLKAWYIDVYLPHKLQMWTHWLDVWLEELSWKTLQSQTGSLTWNSRRTETMVTGTRQLCWVQLCTYHCFKSVVTEHTTSVYWTCAHLNHSSLRTVSLLSH